MRICETERRGNIAILTPTENLGELVYDDFEAVVQTTLEMLEKGEIKHVVIDFVRTDYFGSHTIMSMIQIGKKTRSLGGKLALARLSAHEQEVLQVTKLDSFWPVHASREEATEAVKE